MRAIVGIIREVCVCVCVCVSLSRCPQEDKNPQVLRHEWMYEGI